MSWAPLRRTCSFLILHDFISSPTHPGQKCAQNMHFPDLVQRPCHELPYAQICVKYLQFPDLPWMRFHKLPNPPLRKNVRRTYTFIILSGNNFLSSPRAHLRAERACPFLILPRYDFMSSPTHPCVKICAEPTLFSSCLATISWAPLCAKLWVKRQIAKSRAWIETENR
jgi:hypothetical protein